MPFSRGRDDEPGAASGGELTARVEAWRAAGSTDSFRGYDIHVRRIDGSDPVLIYLHGFPSSSYDFKELIPLAGDNGVLAFDFLGFGLSEKPRGHRYSLFEQADLAAELVQRHFAGRDAFLVAHDMGSSVATELMAREVEGRAAMPLTGALLFNGSLVIERATLSRGQRLLRGRLGPIAAVLTNKPAFRREFARLFSSDHPLSDEETDDQWALMCHNGGRTLGHELISYLDERVRYARRWHGAISDWARALSIAWGLHDPIATTSVLDAVRELRPGVPVDEMPELGHYPQVEDPARVAEALRAAVGRAA